VLQENKELENWCFERLSDFKTPRYSQYRKNLPKTFSQRIAKYLMRDSNARSEIDMSDYIR